MPRLAARAHRWAQASSGAIACNDRDEIDGHVSELAEQVTRSVAAHGRQMTHVAVKVRTAHVHPAEVADR